MTPTPRPRTLAGGGRGWDGSPGPPAGVAGPFLPRTHLMPEKEGAVLMAKRLGPTPGCNPEERVSVGPCPQEPAPDRTQGPSATEETPKSPGLEALPLNGDHKHQQVASARRMDSLEETLRELEATLSQMGMDPTVEPPGSPPPLPPGSQSGGGTVPPMKVVTPGASRLKAAQGQAGSPDKGKHSKQRAEYMRIQAQQQATKPSKEMSGSNEPSSSPVSEKPSASRTSIPVLTSFGARNSSISF